MPRDNHNIDYIELPLVNADETRAFYGSVFGWQFQEWGPDYLGFSGAGIDGGFNRELQPIEPGKGTLVVLFAEHLEATRDAVVSSGSKVNRDIYSFPGGRRFHFTDPNGNELAVWGLDPNA